MYKGKFPERIKSLCSFIRTQSDFEAERPAATSITTNSGAVFAFEWWHHKNGPRPQVGQEIEDWILHVAPVNDLARKIERRYRLQEQEKHVTVALPPVIAAELEYLISVTKAAPAGGFESVADLLRHVAISIADGSRRPGSWERPMLVSMGIVSGDEPELISYRREYGRPEARGGGAVSNSNTPTT